MRRVMAVLLSCALLFCLFGTLAEAPGESAQPTAEIKTEIKTETKQDEPATPEPKADVTPTPLPTPTPSPTPTAAPEASSEPETSAGPVSTTSPEATPTIEAEATPEAETTPETSSQAGGTPTPEAEVSASPEPSPEVAQEEDQAEDDQTLEDGELEIVSTNPYMGWLGVTPTSEQGMAIPMLFQTDYPDIVCTIRGVPRSVATSGCAATSLSMVIAYLTGNTGQNPSVLFCDSVENGRYQGAGWSHATLSYYASKYGVRSSWIANSGSKIREALAEGKPIIAHMGPGIFTRRGHYVVLRGLTSDGKVLINDPVSPTKCRKAFPMSTLLAQCKGSHAFMVCWVDDMPESEDTAGETTDTIAEDTKLDSADEIAEDTQPEPTAEAAEDAGIEAIGDTTEATATDLTAQTAGEYTDGALTATVTGKTARLREGPSKDDAVITMIAGGTRVELLEQFIAPEDGCIWWRVRCGDQTGYIHGDLIDAQQ